MVVKLFLVELVNKQQRRKSGTPTAAKNHLLLLKLHEAIQSYFLLQLPGKLPQKQYGLKIDKMFNFIGLGIISAKLF